MPGMRRPPRTRLGIAALVAAIAVLATVAVAEPYVRAAALLLRFQSPSATPTGLAAYGVVPVAPEDFAIPAGGAATIRGRIYRPRGIEPSGAPGIVLLHGMHRDGIDERRMNQLATVLASSGVTVLTPEIASLTRYRIGEDAVPVIGHAAAALASELGRESVGVMGISFAGGLALLAGADEVHGRHVGFVVTVGAHHDLARVARWYAGTPAEGPSGEHAGVAPHPYGAGVLIYGAAQEFFSAEQLGTARTVLDLVLEGRTRDARARLDELAGADRATAERILEFSRGRGPLALAPGDPLVAAYEASIARHARELAAASPAGRLARYTKPVFLLHGLGDPIVPSTETLWLASELPPARVEASLVTPFLRHAEQADDASARDQWDLVRLMAGVLAAASDGAP